MSTLTRRLPPHPSLDQLRRQAKDLLRQYRAGDPAAVAEVKQFEWRANPAAFALNDAQRVLARAYGFESWPRLKAFVDGVTVRRLADAVQAGDMAQVRVLLGVRPELIDMDLSGGDERRALHFAVMQRDAPLVELLMQAGADAHKGVYPHRDATSAIAIARDRGYSDIVAVIEQEERLRREEMSCPNATVSPAQDRITAAIRNGNTAEAVRLLAADKSLIHACDRQGGTPLHVAAQAANIELIDWLLSRRASVHKQDVSGLTPLDRAALAAHPQNNLAAHFLLIARKLLDRGARVTVRAAVALGDEVRVQEIVAEDPGVLREVRPSGGLLSIAVNHNRTGMVRLLLDLGADVDERTTLDELEGAVESWGTPLWYAALAGRREIAELLLDRGADPNANVYASGWPLRNAWNHPDQSVKSLLLARGARLQPYMIAELHDAEEAQRLLDRDPSEQVATELLEAAADSGCPEITEMALGRLDWPRGDSRWHWYLIQPVRGIGSGHPSHEGHFRCMQRLLDHGIDPDIAVFGQTVLHFTAAWHGDIIDAERARFASMLLDYGARLDLRDEMLRSTPLGWACRWGRKEMVELLIARGAPVEETDAEPWAGPSAWAEKMGQADVLAILRRHGV
jgi:ankyrin repeat protein